MDENVYNALVILTKAAKSILSIGPHGDDLRRVEQLDRELDAMKRTDLGIAHTESPAPARSTKRSLRAAGETED